MIRFAFSLNGSSRMKLDSLRNDGHNFSLNELFNVKSKAKSYEKTTTFHHEEDVLNLLKAIDGTQEDDAIFPFLDYNKIKKGKLA